MWGVDNKLTRIFKNDNRMHFLSFVVLICSTIYDFPNKNKNLAIHPNDCIKRPNVRCGILGGSCAKRIERIMQFVQVEIAYCNEDARLLGFFFLCFSFSSFPVSKNYKGFKEEKNVELSLK